MAAEDNDPAEFNVGDARRIAGAVRRVEADPRDQRGRSKKIYPAFKDVILAKLTLRSEDDDQLYDFTEYRRTAGGYEAHADPREGTAEEMPAIDLTPEPLRQDLTGQYVALGRGSMLVNDDETGTTTFIPAWYILTEFRTTPQYQGMAWFSVSQNQAGWAFITAHAAIDD